MGAPSDDGANPRGGRGAAGGGNGAGEVTTTGGATEPSGDSADELTKRTAPEGATISAV